MLIKKSRFRRFLDFLRSGEIVQTVGVLGKVTNEKRGECAYCVEGAMCEFALREGLSLRRSMDPLKQIVYTDENGLNMTHSATVEVKKYIGLPPKLANSVAYMNQNDCGKDFNQLADMLEADAKPYLET